VGNFLIEYHQEAIAVTQTTPGNGDEVATYTAEVAPNNKDFIALKLLKQIVSANPSIEPYHTAYLGAEIQKAVWQGMNYKQQ
jgi:thymidylate synthase